MLKPKNKQHLLITVTITILTLIQTHHLVESTCPIPCYCEMLAGATILVNCSNQGLTELPPELVNENANSIDLSNNLFTEIPKDLKDIPTLEHLIINDNLISNLAEDALEGFGSLITLQLMRNNITSWAAINPTVLLIPATSLTHLYLNENPLTSFSSHDDSLILVSKTLRRLYLSKCKISKVSGENVIGGLPNLEVLVLKNNPLINIPDLISDSLATLDLSNTRLGQLQPTIFEGLTNLVSVDLSRNHRITLESSTRTVTSTSLKRINLSYCNMVEIELQGFENLLSVILKGNMIRQLNRQSFEKNHLLENIDLSLNSISFIADDTFKDIPNLKKIDLSYNMITRIERDTFRSNEVLTAINLSRNYISRFSRFIVKALTTLNLSGCEIMYIDPDAFGGFKEINEMDLSNNLITIFPEALNSESLQILDLSMCRITSIRNATFQNFPELTKIVLSGNRLTVPPHSSFFDDNPYLQELYLGDNPWRCDCNDEDFSNFFANFMTPFKRIIDSKVTRCVTPDELYGRTWESACWIIWNPDTARMSNAEKIWTFLMVSIIVFAGSVCLIMSIKRCIEGRRLTRQEEARVRNFEDYRQVRQENQMRVLQEAQLNAPNPRETCPPCYEDAILLPKLQGFSSLEELGSNAKDKSKDDAPVLRRCRCRSEEVISMRESVRPDPNARNSRISRLVRNTLLPQSNPPPTIPASPNGIRSGAETQSTHYHATDILNINNRHTHRPAPPTSPPPPPPSEIQNYMGEGSPYSNRRNRISSFRSSGTTSPTNTAIVSAEINTTGEVQQQQNNNTSDRESTPQTSPLIGRNQPRQRRESDF